MKQTFGSGNGHHPQVACCWIDHGRAVSPTGSVRDWHMLAVEDQWNKQPWYCCAGRAPTVPAWQVAGRMNVVGTRSVRLNKATLGRANQRDDGRR